MATALAGKRPRGLFEAAAEGDDDEDDDEEEEEDEEEEDDEDDEEDESDDEDEEDADDDAADNVSGVPVAAAFIALCFALTALPPFHSPAYLQDDVQAAGAKKPRT